MRAFVALQQLLRGHKAIATRESPSDALAVGSEVSHSRLGHGTVVRLYDDQSVASAEVLFGNGNIQSCATTSLTGAPPRQPLADRGTQAVPAESLPNPLNAAR